MPSKKPDFNLWAVIHNPAGGNDSSATVGAGWTDDDGAISIKLNVGVVLDARTVLRLKLYKWETPEERREKGKRKEAEKPATRSHAFDEMDDDIPF